MLTDPETGANEPSTGKKPVTDDKSQPNICKIDIVESYKNYKPPIRVRAAVERLVGCIPDKYKWGLKTIVLTDTASLSRGGPHGKLKSRNKRVQQRDCRGMYMQKWKGEPAWIRLIVDNTLSGWNRFALRIPLLQDIAIGEVLYHEFGHHIHETKKPEFKEKEDVADRWSARLMVMYLRKQYWYLTPIFVTVAHTLKFHRRIRARFKR